MDPYALPSALVLPLAIAAGIGFAIAGRELVHRRFDGATFLEHNDVAGFIIAVVGTLYAVVLGFVTVVVWQQYDQTRERVAIEAAAAGDAWHVSVGLPPRQRARLRRDLVAYANEMVDREWPAMRRDGFSTRGDMLIMDATETTGDFVPADARATNAQAATLAQLASMHDERQRRIASNVAGVSGFEWAILGLGAVVVVAFCWLFGVGHAAAHRAMTAAVAVLVAAMFVLIFELQFPFRSDLGVAATPWRGFLAHVRLMDDRGSAAMRM